jgi:hypothetical protein
MTDMTAHGGMITVGCGTVLIGTGAASTSDPDNATTAAIERLEELSRSTHAFTRSAIDAYIAEVRDQSGAEIPHEVAKALVTAAEEILARRSSTPGPIDLEKENSLSSQAR